MSISAVKASLMSSPPQGTRTAHSVNGAGAATGFSATLTLQIAQMRSQNLASVLPAGTMAGASGATSGATSGSALDTVLGFRALSGGALFAGNGAGLFTGSGSAIDALSYLSGLGGGVSEITAVGRNPTLFDPESAYRMMSLINQKEASYKAEFVELGDMKTTLASLRSEGDRLREINSNAPLGELRARLDHFVAAYNDWIRHFDGELRDGGVFADSEAARVAHFELRQSVEYQFHGASAGMRGMSELGLSIDPTTRLASFDPQRLATTLDKNRPGVVATLREFGTSFARSAELLIAENNFIPNRLGQLDRVLGYLRDNIAPLRKEFGQGDPAEPKGRIAAAITRYEGLRAT